MNFQNVSPGVWLCNKPVSITPLEAILELKKQKPALKNKPITYAGRLDPMAEGLLLLLAGNKVHHKTKFLNLDKTYQVKMLLGIQTDSFDLLGLPEKNRTKKLSTQTIKTVLHGFQGETLLPLPPFSSPPVDGKPLHVWARKGIKKNAQLRHSITYSIDKVRTAHISSLNLSKYLQKQIAKVSGDFRQKQTLWRWHRLLSKHQNDFQTVSFEVKCSSGTYIRALVNEAGKKLHTTAVLYSLKRQSIGKYNLSAIMN